jgi:hypothetical protein
LIEGNGESDEFKQAPERIPRISRYMALAIHFEDLIKQGLVTDYADLARLGHVSRARVTQIMNLRLLTPEIQEQLLHCETSEQLSCPLQLKELQRLASHHDWRNQRVQWRQQNRDSD